MTWVRLTIAAVVLASVVHASAAGPDVPPTRTRALLAWLRDAPYRATWLPEPAVHVSETDAHGLHVRTWYSPVLAEDLRQGVARYRREAAMVKELYFAGTDDVVGWSVMRKVRRRSAAGRGWFFFETFDGERPLARGRGVRICVQCHRDGADFLLSAFRPPAPTASAAR
jgi:hypothetical protein